MNQIFTINHINYTHFELLLESHRMQDSNRPDWEKAVWNFMKEWLNENDFVQLHTSGSTGIPKEIRVEKTYMRNSAMMTLGFLGLRAGNTALLCLSANYVAGKMMIVRALEGGLDLLIAEPLGNPMSNCTEKIDFAAMVPLQVQKVIEEEGISKLETIHHLIIGGAAVNPPLAEQLSKVHSNMWATYGMTETVSHIALKRLSGETPPSCFTPLPSVAISTDDRDCLVIDAPHLCAKKVVTNDIVSIDDKSCFTFLGRYDNIINSGGVKLVPEQIEGKIAHLIYERFFVSSVPDERLGQRVVLVIESLVDNGTDCKSAQENLELANKQLIETMKTMLSGYELPRDIIHTPQLKETESGKVIRELP